MAMKITSQMLSHGHCMVINCLPLIPHALQTTCHGVNAHIAGHACTKGPDEAQVRLVRETPLCHHDLTTLSIQSE